MSDEVYERLRRFMDEITPLGFPKTKAGTEWPLLKFFFTPEAAEAVTHLTLVPEPLEAIGNRMGKNPEETEALLGMLEDDGLILSMPAGKTRLFAAVPFAPGIIELNMQRITSPDFSRQFFDYIEQAWGPRLVDGKKIPFVRTLPVGDAVPTESVALPHERTTELLAKVARPIVVLDCYCRTLKEKIGEACGKPLEVCFYFGPFGAHYLSKGIGREVDDNEFLRIMKEANDAGLVHLLCNAASFEDQPNMCNCCGCCCGALGTINKLSPETNSRTAFGSSHYVASIDEDKCSGCEICMERCQIRALYMDDGLARVRDARCIGCGLCVSTCPEEAIALIDRDKEDMPDTPTNLLELYRNLQEERRQEGRTK